MVVTLGTSILLLIVREPKLVTEEPLKSKLPLGLDRPVVLTFPPMFNVADVPVVPIPTVAL